MDKNSNKYVVLFQGGVCVILAVMLAGAYNGLSDRISANEEFDKQKNVLKAVGLWDPATEASKPRAELEQLFAERMRVDVLEVKRAMVEQEVKRAGDVITVEVPKVVDVTKTEIAATDLKQVLREESKKPPAERRELVPFYTKLDAGGQPAGYCIPISGYGLWSTLYGYLALEADCNTVKGITFYKHGETPGLGGEVENPNWQASWEGKQVLGPTGELVSVTVVKGAAPADALHAVDGLSGATITSNGVTRFVERDLETYEPYFRKIR